MHPSVWVSVLKRLNSYLNFTDKKKESFWKKRRKEKWIFEMFSQFVEYIRHVALDDKYNGARNSSGSCNRLNIATAYEHNK